MSGPSLVVVGLSSTKDPLCQNISRMPSFWKISGAFMVNGMVNLGIRVFNSIQPHLHKRGHKERAVYHVRERRFIST